MIKNKKLTIRKRKQKKRNAVGFYGFPRTSTPLLNTAVQTTLRACPGGARFIGELNYVLVSDREIRRMNKRYLHADRVTDVMSFTLEKKPLSGDVYIASGRSKAQAKMQAHAWGAELMYLVIHGTLHLLGCTDYTPGTRKKMFVLQDRIFNRLAH